MLHRSRRDLPFRGALMIFFVFTMYFGGGLIPTYVVVNTLHLTNTRWILILFGSISVYNIVYIVLSWEGFVNQKKNSYIN